MFQKTLHAASTRILVFLFFALVFLAGDATGQEAATQPAQVEAPGNVYAKAIEKSRKLIARRIEQGSPGFSVAVAIDGEIVWKDAQGLANVSEKIPVTEDTRFRIGSTSKSITSALAGRLLDRGEIDLDANIRTVFPEFPAKEYPISLRHLLSCQAGIRHYKGDESLNKKAYPSVAAGLAIFQDDPLQFEPGTNAFYSSYGFNLAGAVLAKKVGLSYGEAVVREIFQPLGMTASGVDDPEVEIPERATFYSQWNGPLTEAVPVNDAYKAPSGGLLSTPTDMVTFGSALLSGLDAEGGKWLSRETFQHLVTKGKLADGRTAGYALGFRVQDANPEVNPPVPYAVHHGGSSIGGRSMLMIFPDEGLVVSLLCNADNYKKKEKDAAAIAGYFREAKTVE